MRHRDISGQNQDAALEAYRAAACAEADAHFDDRALEAQRHKILARLEHLGHPAKVIRFPKAPQGDVPSTSMNRGWISVAAAAGLIIGLLGGQVVHLLPHSPVRLAPMATSIAPSAATSNAAIVQASAPIDDDGFLSEIELVMEVRGASELRALDEFTPLASR
jgi:hypothetical protein